MKEVNPFYVCNGNSLFSLEDLLNELKNIEDNFFFHHVSGTKNDFSAWVLYELKEKALSNQLSKTNEKEKMIKSIEKRLNKLSELKKKKEIIHKIKGAIENE